MATAESSVRVPRYVRLAESLIARIEAGDLAPGDRLPTERALTDQWGVTRPTVRQALQVLKMRGLLTQRQGDGTYVAAPKIERAAGRLSRFTHDMRGLGYAPAARIILFERQQADATSAEQLRLTRGAPVYYCHRLRLIGAEPVLLERFTTPATRFPGLERHDLANRSIYEIMETEYGVAIAHARQSLEPVVATPYEAELLGIAPGAPLMLEQRLTADRAGRPVEYGTDLYRGDRFRFVTETALVDGEQAEQLTMSKQYSRTGA